MKKEIELILSEAGWYEERKIEIDYMIDDLQREGSALPNPLIEALLREYWNLELNFITPDGKYGSIRLNTEVALGIENKILNRYEGYVNEKLVSVGSINDESALLFVSFSGKFYMAANGIFFKIGDDFFEALDTIIFQKDVIRIYPPL